jgi:branched-chain amino acid transport system substrate-binding protein
MRACLKFMLAALTLSTGLAVAQDKVKIGVVQPMTGPTAHDGHRIVKAIRLYTDLVNKQGGVLGKQIELVIADNQSKPQESVNAFERLVTQDKVSAMICCWGSSNTLAVMPRLEQARMPIVVETGTSPKLTAPGAPGLKWTYRLLTHQGMDAKAHAAYLKSQGFKRFGFIALNNDWGHSLIKEFGGQAREMGMQVVAEEKYQPGEQNFLPFISKVKSSGADVVFLNGDAQALALLVKQAKEQALKATLIVTAGDFDQLVRDAGAAAAEGVHSIDYYDAGNPSAVSKEFVKQWVAAYPTESPSHQGPASGYSAMMLIVDAIKRANSADPSKIRDALETAKLETPLGLIDFDANHQAHPYSFLKVLRNGKVELLKAVPTR